MITYVRAWNLPVLGGVFALLDGAWLFFESCVKLTAVVFGELTVVGIGFVDLMIAFGADIVRVVVGAG